MLVCHGEKRKSFVRVQLWHGRRCGYWSDASARPRLFIGYLWRGGYTFGGWGVGARSVCRATVENAVRSVGFIGGFAIGVIAGWPRNELAEAQFNKSEVLPY